MAVNGNPPALEYQLVAKLQARKITRREALASKETICGICLEELLPNTSQGIQIAKVAHCNCKAIYCYSCLIEWFHTRVDRMRCPLCKVVGALDFGPYGIMTRAFTNEDVESYLDYFDVRSGAPRYKWEELLVMKPDAGTVVDYFVILGSSAASQSMIKFLFEKDQYWMTCVDLKSMLIRAASKASGGKMCAKDIEEMAEKLTIVATRAWRLEARKTEFGEEFDRASRTADHLWQQRELKKERGEAVKQQPQKPVAKQGPKSGVPQVHDPLAARARKDKKKRELKEKVQAQKAKRGVKG